MSIGTMQNDIFSGVVYASITTIDVETIFAKLTRLDTLHRRVETVESGICTNSTIRKIF